MPNLTLSLLSDSFAVCRFAAGTQVPPPPPTSFGLVVHAAEETTLVCTESEAPAKAHIVDAGWRCLRIEQSFDFSVPGILASVLQPLADAKVGIFATSTFSTDYVLVKALDTERAVAALVKAGHEVKRPL
ncbi:ACT domain-containing protein [Microvirga flavescens]|uniref:ACT domain-containing protein n=1 Tax=Microvirga flavescens TaxID=2249811 RepID=UPI000DD64C86|nr:ACT domain-containing protein [Microvirga flavescens]